MAQIHVRNPVMPFPLYDFLEVSVRQNPPKVDLTTLTRELSQLPNDHAAVVQYILLHANSKLGGTESIPFYGSRLPGGRGVRYNLTRLDPRVHAILHIYIKMARKYNG